MKNTKKAFRIILIAGIFFAILSGCSKKEDKANIYNNTVTSDYVNPNSLNTKSENNKSETPKSESTKMVHLTAAEFKQKVFNYETEKDWKFTGDKPVIIDFYADWCGPCKMVAPVLEELSKEYDGKVQIYKVDTETEQELASVFGIRSIPSILFIPKEGKPQMSTGAMQKAGFIQAIQEILLVN
ncbi:MAG: thioredoxin [Ignavibacteria bacterium]